MSSYKHKKNPNNPTFCSSLINERLHFQDLEKSNQMPPINKQPSIFQPSACPSPCITTLAPMFPPIKKQSDNMGSILRDVYNFSQDKRLQIQPIQKKKEDLANTSKIANSVHSQSVYRDPLVYTSPKPQEKKAQNDYIQSCMIYNRFKYTENNSPIPHLAKNGYADQKQIMKDLQNHTPNFINPLIGKYLKNIHQITF